MKEMQNSTKSSRNCKHLVYGNTIKTKRKDKYVTSGARHFENIIAKNCSQKNTKYTTPLG